MAKRKKGKLNKLASDNIKLGVTSMVGQNVVGVLGSKTPGSLNTVRTINTSLHLTNVGQLVKTARKII